MGIISYLAQNFVAAFFVSAGVLTNNFGALLGGMLLSPILDTKYLSLLYLTFGISSYILIGYILQAFRKKDEKSDIADDDSKSIYLNGIKSWKKHLWFYLLIPVLLGFLVKSKITESILISLVVGLTITVTPALVSSGIFVAKYQFHNAFSAFQLGLANIALYILGFILM